MSENFADGAIKILNSEQKFTISTFDSLLLPKDELLKNQGELLKHLDGQNLFCQHHTLYF